MDVVSAGRAEGSASSQPSSGRRSAREAPRRPRGSRTHYRSVSDVDVDGISCLPGEGIATVNTGYQVSALLWLCDVEITTNITDMRISCSVVEDEQLCLFLNM